MTKIISLRYLMAALVILTGISVKAQLLTPPRSHDYQHQDLLANQRSLTNQIKIDNNKLLQNMREQEMPEDLDVFIDNWDSPSVNPYVGAVIPTHQDIDVTDFVMPLKNVRVTSNYGYRPRFRRQHRGIDLGLSVGDTVYAAFSGKVRLVKYEARGYGYYVVIRHENGLETVYGHLSRQLVKPDQWVKAGEPIALGGNTGRSTGPHLHFETRFMGLAINPAAIIDFENNVTHKDIFAFDKATYEKSQSYKPAANKTKAKRRTTTASKRKKTTRRKSSRR